MTTPTTDDTPQTGTALATVRAAAGLPASYPDERIHAIYNYCKPSGKAVSPAELAVFLAVCVRYGLDPLLGEVWLGVIDGKIQPITGRNTFVKLAKGQKDYGGIQSGVVYEADEFYADWDQEAQRFTITHKIAGFQRGKLVGSYCQLFLKDRPAIYKQKAIEEYKHLATNPSKKNWLLYPADMLEVRSLVAAMRQAWPLSGLSDPAEEGIDNVEDAASLAEEDLKDKTLDRAAQLRERLRTSRPAKKEEKIEDAVVLPDPANEDQTPAFEPGDADESISPEEQARLDLEEDARLLREGVKPPKKK